MKVIQHFSAHDTKVAVDKNLTDEAHTREPFAFVLMFLGLDLAACGAGVVTGCERGLLGGPNSLLDSLPGSVTNLLCDLSVPVFSCMRNQIKWGFDTCKCYKTLDPPVLCECGESLPCVHLES